jgi:hypothetical protein
MTSAWRRASSLMLAGFFVIVLAFGAQCEPALAEGDATQQSSCEQSESSPGFRSSLPDCRAYELVTPPYAGGAAMLWSEREQPPVSSNGQHLLGQSLAGFGNVEDNENSGFEFGAIYEFSRTSSGWVDEPLNLSASTAARQRFVAASADLQRTLWRVDVQTGSDEEVIKPEDFTFVVREAPETPNGAAPRFSSAAAPPEAVFVGASEDLSTILFESADQLYETHPGVGGEPRPLGVLEHGELASECATTIGTGGYVGPSATGASAYNAVSSDGTVVYFTAAECNGQPAANDLYVQHEYSWPINLSEPSPEVCAECKTAGPQEAIFEGASSDGSKAFFLSAQALLPGAEGQSLYEYDAESPAGHQVTLVAGETAGVARISEDGSHAFFVSTDALSTEPETRSGCTVQPCQPVSEQDNLYSLDTATGRVAFVATLSPADANDWMQEDSHRPAETTPNGQFLVFPSAAQLTPGDTSGEAAPQIFEYDSQTEALTRVSIGHEGYDDDGNTGLEADTPKLAETPQFEASTRPTDRWSHLSLTAGGDVFFTSADRLVAGAVAGRENVYEYDFSENDVYLISAGDEASPLAAGTMPRYLGTDESGEDAFLLTEDSLVPQDVDTQASWYDARVGGGFPEPFEAMGCRLTLCEGSSSSASQPPSIGGSEAVVPEDPQAPSGPSAGTRAKPKAKTLSRAQKLTRALRACKKVPKKRRRACDARAEKAYGAKGKTTKHGRQRR